MQETRCQRGIALFQVLLLSVILSLLSIYITQKVNQQTQAAFRLTDKMLALTNAKTAESELFFIMLTNPIETYKGVKGWNLHGEFFEFQPGVQVSIQDLNGLIGFDHELDEKLLIDIIRQSGLHLQPEKIAQSMLDFTDSDASERGAKTEKNRFDVPLPNRPVQHISELSSLSGMTPQLLNYLDGYLNWYSLSLYNPGTSPEPVLSLRFGEGKTKEILSLRQKGLEYASFFRALTQITGLSEGETTVSFAGPVYRIILKSSVGEGFWAYKLTVFLDKQNQKQPLRFLSREPLFQDV